MPWSGYGAIQGANTADIRVSINMTSDKKAVSRFKRHLNWNHFTFRCSRVTSFAIAANESVCLSFYVLGPLVTDIAPGDDHITSAIGGALAAMHGADFLCYVTPAEHLCLPSLEDVKEGIMASKIAAHAVDLAKGLKGADAIDHKMSKARGELDWDGQFACAIDPEKADAYRKSSQQSESSVCTMCSDFCAVKRVGALL